MKLYKRQVKPYYSDPSSYYRGNNVYELEKNGKWYDEDLINVQKWLDTVREEEKRYGEPKYSYELELKERYVPITKNDFVKHATTFDFDDNNID